MDALLTGLISSISTAATKRSDGDDNKAYAKGETIANQFEIRGIGSSDNDHLQDAKFARYADLPQSELGKLPGAMVA